CFSNELVSWNAMTNSRAIVCMLARQVEGLEIIRYLICRHAEDALAVRFAFSAVQHRDDLAVTIEDRTPRRPRGAVRVNLHDRGQRLAHGPHGQRRLGDRVAALEPFACPGQARHTGSAALDRYTEHTDIGLRRHADHVGAPKLRTTREDHAEPARRLGAVLTDEDVFVRNHRALRVYGERGAAVPLAVGVLDQHHRDRILILVRDRAVIDAAHGAGQRALPSLRRIQLPAEPGDRWRVAAGTGQLATQPRRLVLRGMQ